MPGARLESAAVAVAVFLSGGVLLGLEITASRILAPTFGSSLFVWGALIGVVLTGLAIGYWLGGVAADRFPSPHLFVGAIALGAALVLAVPLADRWVLELVVTWDPGPRLDPLVAAAILFGPPSIVLASASPIAVRLAARSFERLGRTAGRLFSISTAGSIAGTFLTAFWLVPALGTDQVLAAGAVALLAAALVVAAAARLVLPAAVLTVAAAATIALTVSLAPESGGRLQGFAAQNWSPLYRIRESRVPRRLDPAAAGALGEGVTIREARDTRYHRMLVVDEAGGRLLRFDNSYQSGMWLGDPFRTRFRYTDYLGLGIAYNPGARRVLFVGLGGGSAPKRFWRDFPRLSLQAVELDPDVVAAAYRWFALPRDRRLQVAVEDGRRYLQRRREAWDVIVIDAFYADAIPFHLATREFVQLARTRLAPGGTVVVNLIGAIAGDSSKLLRSIVKTYRTVFPTVLVHPVGSGSGDPDPTSVTNVILVATDRAAPNRRVGAQTWARLRAGSRGAPDLSAAFRDRWEAPLRFDDVPILTDGYAPTDALLLE